MTRRDIRGETPYTTRQCLRGIAITTHDAVGERPVVHPDAYGRVMLTTDVEQPDKPCAQPLQLGGILFIGIIDVLERAGAVDEVAGVDAHFLDNGGRHFGNMWIEVYVGHQRGMVAAPMQFIFDSCQTLGLPGALCGEPHIVGTGFDDAYALFDTLFHILCGGIGHRLYAYGVIATQRGCSDVDFGGMAALVVEKVHGVRKKRDRLSLPGKFLLLSKVFGIDNRCSCRKSVGFESVFYLGQFLVGIDDFFASPFL